MRFKIYQRCPLCHAKRVEGSGGWAVDYQCGTRRGNLSQSILWRGPACVANTNPTQEERFKNNLRKQLSNPNLPSDIAESIEKMLNQ